MMPASWTWTPVRCVPGIRLGSLPHPILLIILIKHEEYLWTWSCPRLFL